MDNIDWANINSFKKNSQGQKSTLEAYKLDDIEKEDDEDQDEDEDEDEYEENSKDEANDLESQIETFKKIIPYLKPGETILRAIKRLGKTAGGSSGSSGSGTTLSASQRWLKKKNQPSEASQTSSSNPADKEAVEKLTGFANFFIDRGFYDIYEETYEKLRRKIDESEKSAAGKQESFDIFADEVKEDDIKAGGSGSKKEEILQGNFSWVFV